MDKRAFLPAGQGDEMEQVKVTPLSGLGHNAQILTGFLMLKQKGWDIRLENCPAHIRASSRGQALVRAEYMGKTILYDLWDGYQCAEEIRLGLDQADFYFKRSFSREKNSRLFPEHCRKMHPLGFNYYVTHPRGPYSEPLWKAAAKTALGRVPDRYFRPGVFEGRAAEAKNGALVLFLTRLWEEQEPGLTEQLREERHRINKARIEIIRLLRRSLGPAFTGGLNDAPLSRKLAPDLILPDRMTRRREYLRLLHDSDICIGTMGLHESIGWKTGEYVAAAKAIVCEDLRYEVPGNFSEGVHYLPFSSPEECLQAVRKLRADPDGLFAMKAANEEYYRRYLRPDVLVENTLAVVRREL